MLAVNTTVVAVVAPPESDALSAVHGANVRVVRPHAAADGTESLQRAMACLRPICEATVKIDWRALRETAKSVNVEAGQASSSPFVFGRANLVREP